MKKKLFGKVASCVAASCLTISMMFTTSYAAEATNTVDAVKHDGNYSIETILSRYQYFVKGNLKVNNHTVGAFVSGGDVEIGAYGDGAIVDSYANNVKAVGNYNSGSYFNGVNAEKYSGYLGKKLYYKTTDAGVQLTDKMVPNGSYINVDTAFGTIKEKSESLADNADKRMTIDNLKTFMFDGLKCKVLLLQFSESVDNISIEKDAFDACDLIVLKGEESLDDFVASQKVINILGDDLIEGAAIGSNYSYTSPNLNEKDPLYPNDPKKAILFSSNKGVRTIQEVDNANNVLKLELMDDGNGLKTLKDTPLSIASADQLRESGVKLIWNLPEAKALGAEFVPGHVVAPNADITISGGNFEGGYIAASITSNAEGHFYPYNKLAEYDAPETPAQGEDDKTPAQGEDDKKPTQGEDDKTPTQGEDDKTPTQGEDGKTPTQGEDGKTPTQDEDGKTPTQDEDGKTPTQGEDGKTPTQDEDGKTPTQGEDGKTPTQGDNDESGTTEGANTEDSGNDNITTENTASNDSDKTTATQDKETDGANDSNKTTTTQDTANGGSSDKKKTPTTDTVVSTGDDFDVAVPTALMLMVGAGVVLCIEKKKKIK